MIFYENKNNSCIDAEFNEDCYLVIHWTYREALEKFKKMMRWYNWMESYINHVTRKEDNKFFVYDGNADEIKQMMNDIKRRQEEILQLLKR